MRHQLKTWRGIQSGWVNVGRPKTYQEAMMLQRYVQQVQKTFIHKVDVLPIELFPIN